MKLHTILLGEQIIHWKGSHSDPATFRLSFYFDRDASLTRTEVLETLGRVLSSQPWFRSVGRQWVIEIHLQALNGQLEHFTLEQKPDVLHEWVAQLRLRFHGQKVAIAIEQRKGAVIHALMMHDFLVLYPVNPKTLARYREAFRTSGAKDDRLETRYRVAL